MKSIRSFAVIMLLVIMGAGCASKAPPPAVPMAAQPPCKLTEGASVPLIAASVEGAVTLEWSASIGEISPKQGPAVTYTAPLNYSGDAVIVLTTRVDDQSVSANLICTIIPLPTATPTITPEPATLTLEPTFTPSPTTTPPPPIIDIFPMNNEGEEFTFINSGGSLAYKFMPTPACVHSGVYGLQLTYAMSGSGNGGWGVHWDASNSRRFDASGFNAFTFWVKGTYGGETYQVGILDTNGKEIKVESIKLSITMAEWTKVIAPFSKFQGVNFASLKNINVGFNKNHGTGSICLDDFAFENIP